MRYPLYVIEKRLRKNSLPGVVLIGDKMYSTASVDLERKDKKLVRIWLGISAVLVLVAAILVFLFYIQPYFKLNALRNELAAKTATTESLFRNTLLSEKLAEISITEYTTVNYADMTVMVSIPVMDNLSDLLEVVSSVKGVQGVQFATDTLHIVLLRGAL